MKQLFIIAVAFCFFYAPAASAGEDLLEIYRLASENDPRLRAAEASLGASEAGRRQIRASLFPSVVLSGISGHTELDENSGRSNYDSYNYELSLTQALYNRGDSILRSQADSEVERAKAEYEIARQDLANRVVEAYLEVLSAGDDLEFARLEKSAVAEQVDLTQHRFKAGVVAMVDVHSAQAAYDLAVAQEVSASYALQRKQAVLEEITGHEHGTLLPLREDGILQASQRSLPDWLLESALSSPSIQAEKYKVKSAQAEISRQSAAHYPILNLLATHSNLDNYDNIYDSQRMTNFIGVQLNLSIYEGGKITAGTDRARFLLEQANAQEEQTRRQISRSLKEAYQGMDADADRVRVLERALSSTSKALDATQAAFDAGRRDTTHVLNAQRDVYRAKRDYARARHEYLVNQVRLKKQAGLLTPDELEQLNSLLKH